MDKSRRIYCQTDIRYSCYIHRKLYFDFTSELQNMESELGLNYGLESLLGRKKITHSWFRQNNMDK